MCILYLFGSNYIFDLEFIILVMHCYLAQCKNSIFISLAFILLTRSYCNLCLYVCMVFVASALDLLSIYSFL